MTVMMEWVRSVSVLLLASGLLLGVAAACDQQPATVATLSVTAAEEEPDGELAGESEAAALTATAVATPAPTVPSVSPTVAPDLTEAGSVPEPSSEPAATATPATDLYVIQPGDTLLGLALARGIELAELQALNPDVRAEALQIGQQIVVPALTTGPVDRGLDAPGSGSLVAEWITVPAEPGLWVIGQVANSGEQTLAPVQLTITVLGADGREITTAVAWTAGRRIDAGGLAPFALYVPTLNATDVTAHALVAPPGLASGTTPAVGVLDVDITYNGLAPEVSGRILNEDVVAVSDLLLTVTFYDSAGQYAGYRQLELPEELPPGAERPFTMAALPVQGEVASVTVQVDARVAGE